MFLISKISIKLNYSKILNILKWAFIQSIGNWIIIMKL